MSKPPTYYVSEGCYFEDHADALKHDDTGPWAIMVDQAYYLTLLALVGELQAWKTCAMETYKAIDYFEHPEMLVGASKVKTLIRFAKERDELLALVGELEKTLKFYGNRDNYDREGQVAHYTWKGEPGFSEMTDCWVDYGFTAREALEKLAKFRGEK